MFSLLGLATIGVLLIFITGILLNQESMKPRRKILRNIALLGGACLVVVFLVSIFDTEYKVIEKSNEVTSQYQNFKFSKPVRIITYERQYKWADMKNTTDHIDIVVE
jgi:hypothetical protein